MAHLRNVAKEVWVIDHPLKVGGLQLGTRTTVVRLAGGDVWVHSPGPLQPELTTEIHALGAVRALVAPNAMHHLYLSQHLQAFPHATVYVSPALPAKLKSAFPYEALRDESPRLWSDDFAQHLVGGIPKLQEVVFFHHVSRTLMLTDLAFNIQQSDSWFTRVFMRLNGAYGRFGPSRIFRTMVKDRAALRSSLNRIQEWDFDRIIVTHGEVLETGGKNAMRSQYAWV
ncbi:MAG: DUF4336 domain-containing protein [Deltaproteobacteria bacterium]|nr:DUF4336 domain-containing protein [Deltaproteobacteria bacterium]